VSDRGASLVEGLAPAERRRLLALFGRLPPSLDEAGAAAALRALVAEPRFIALLQRDVSALGAAFAAGFPLARWPGRAEALRALAQALGAAVPEIEYALPEHDLLHLVDRARALHGRRVVLRGEAGHKGRVGDGVERLLVGDKVPGKRSDHAAAEIKSVPVRGDQVIERVKLGVVSGRSDPLAKCDRVLFVFVEARGADHFVRGHAVVEFDRSRWEAMWRDGDMVETAAGSPRHPARGLYLVPRWFRRERLWPQ
jgi:hypothetical protein